MNIQVCKECPYCYGTTDSMYRKKLTIRLACRPYSPARVSTSMAYFEVKESEEENYIGMFLVEYPKDKISWDTLKVSGKFEPPEKYCPMLAEHNS